MHIWCNFIWCLETCQVVQSQLTTFTFCENPCFNADVPTRRQVLPLGELSDYEKTRLEEVKAMDVGDGDESSLRKSWILLMLLIRYGMVCVCVGIKSD